MWLDSTTALELTQEEIGTLVECTTPVTIEECPQEIVQYINCAIEEVLGSVSIGDSILTVIKRDCEGVVISTSQFNLTTGAELEDVAVLTGDCNPEPDIVQTEECLLDSANVKWTEITIVEGIMTTTLYINQETLTLGTPAGEPSEWTSCEKTCTDWKIREGETCNDVNYPNGTKVQWVEGIDCDGNIIYPAGEIYYENWGSVGATGSTQPPLAELVGIPLVEGLETAVHTTNSNYTASYVTGLTNQQTWVNMQNGDVIEGTFSNTWTAGVGGELVLETQWSPNQIFIVELLLEDNTYTAPQSIAFGASVGTQLNTYQFGNGSTGSGTGSLFVSQVDFATFGITTEGVIGIRITLTNSTNPDFSGAYISDTAILKGNTSLEVQPTSIVPIGCCEDCLITEKEVVSCAAESTSEVSIGDIILSVLKENCEGTPIEMTQYNVSNNNALLTIPVFTEDCPDTYSTEKIKECIKDSEGMQWTQIAVVDSLGNVISQIFYDIDLIAGTPAGTSDEWSSCEQISGDFEQEKICGAYKGQSWKGYSRTVLQENGSYITQYFDFSGNEVNGVVEVCCDDCIQYAGCVDFRLAVASQVTLTDGTVISVGGTGKSQDVIDAVTAQCGGTGYYALGLNQGGQSISCNNVNVGEFVFTNIGCELESFTTQFGTYPFTTLGKCNFTPTPCEITWMWVNGCTLNHPTLPDGTPVRWLEGVDCNGDFVEGNGEIYTTGEGSPVITVTEGCSFLGGGGVTYGSDGGVPVASWTTNGNDILIEGIGTTASWIITNQIDTLVNLTTSTQVYRIVGFNNGVEVASIWIDPIAPTQLVSYDVANNPHPINITAVPMTPSGCTALDNLRNTTPDLIPSGTTTFDKIGIRQHQLIGTLDTQITNATSLVQVGFEGISGECPQQCCPVLKEQYACVAGVKTEVLVKWDKDTMQPISAVSALPPFDAIDLNTLIGSCDSCI